MSEHNGLAYELEMLMDKHGLSKVLFAMAQVCHDKAEHAEHIAMNWQDTTLAKEWLKDAMSLEMLAAKTRKI